MMALLCAFLKILSMMFFQFKDLIPTIKGLLAPPDELKGLMAEKERDADLSTLLLDLLKTEESQALLTQAIELIGDDATDAIKKAADSLIPVSESYVRAMNDETLRWFNQHRTEGKLVNMAAQTQQLGKITAPIDAFHTEAMALGAVVSPAASISHEHVRATLT